MNLKAAVQLAKKLHYKLFQAPKGYGEAVSRELLDRQYREGFWGFLDSLDEMANHMVTVGYVRHLSKTLNRTPRLLDIGCGHGSLLELLNGLPFKHYLGVDISAEALKQAEARGIENSSFVVANFEDWSPTEKYDIIISTGSICYAKNPVEALLRCSHALDENGAIIVSLWRYGYNGVMWQNLEKHFAVIDSTTVTNHKGVVWDVKVLRPKEQGPEVPNYSEPI